MGKARIHGSNADILINGVKVGEVDKFSAKNLGELKKSQPLGDKTVTSQVVHKGWDLSFEGGKVDWAMAALLHGQDENVVSGTRSPYFTVKQKITFFDNTVEAWEYPDVTIYGYEIDVPIEEITEKFQGFCGSNRRRDDGTSDSIEDRVEDVATIIRGIISQ